MKRPRIGILGCGKQGAKHLAALMAIGGAEAAVADVDAARARALAEKAGVAARPPDALLDDANVDAVVICTPSPAHGEAIARALAAGKHVLCEKPVAETAAEVERLIEAELASAGRVAVGYLYRFVPAFARARSLLRADDGEAALGRPLHALFRIGARGDAAPWKHRRSEGGGAINEALVHMLDLAQWLLGPLARIELVEAALMRPERRIGEVRVAADVEDYVVVRGRSESGAAVLIVADMVTPGFIQFVDLQATNGSLFGSILSNLPDRLFLKEARNGLAAGAATLDAPPVDLYRAQMAAFLGLIAGRDYPERHGLADSLAVARLIETVGAPARNGRGRQALS